MPTDVHSIMDMAARVEERHAASLAEYRDCIRRMAADGGQLSDSDAERLLQVSRELGIPPERIATDTEIVIRANKLEAEIEDVLNRNVARREPLARLKAEYEAAQSKWQKVRVECEQKLKSAEAELNAAQRAYAEIDSIDDERVDQRQNALVNVRNAAPWLFGVVPAETIRRFLS